MLSKIQEIHKLKNNTALEQDYKNKAFFYRVVPPFLDLKYNKENHDLVKFFLIDTPASHKLNLLNNIYTTKDLNRTVDVCCVILKLHANHGNNVEERAGEILSEIGKPATQKMHQLFQSNISTCSITNLGYAMAKIKDNYSWKLLTDYLKMMSQMPSTMIPPNIPGALIAYDEDKGLTEVLKEIKSSLRTKKSENDLGLFGNYIFYLALDKVEKKKVETEAKKLGFTDKEITDTIKKIYEK